MLDFSRCRLAPFAHQREDTAWLIEHPWALIASEMRTGKTKIVIDAAQFLFEAGTIDRVIVVAPAPVRDVWYDPVLGELAKHLWLTNRVTVVEFHARLRQWYNAKTDRTIATDTVMGWYVTNFEFIRSKARLAQLLAICGPKTLLVLDESSFVKNHAAQQTKACLQLRRACGRVVLLNGTPIFHSPLDLFSQGNILHHSVLECKYITHFKAKYAIQESVLGWGGRPLDNGYGRPVQKITDWTNLDDLERRFAPVTVRRLQAECLDLPPKLDPVTLTATLTPETWKTYKSMRDELVVWLKSGDVAVSATAAVKALRLSQITAGFLGGVEAAGIGSVEQASIYGLDPDTGEIRMTVTDFTYEDEVEIKMTRLVTATQEVGREKLDVLLWFIAQRLEADPNMKVVVWCRFRAEMFRIIEAVQGAQMGIMHAGPRIPQENIAAIHGGQKRAERLRALALLKPETSPVGPVFVAGIEGTGSFGLDMTASHTCVTMSSGYSPGRSAQTLDRVYGPGQKFPIAYFNVVAVGPKGQRTIDHDILTARLAGEDVARRTSAAWVRALTEE